MLLSRQPGAQGKGSTIMSYGVINHFKGGTRKQYDAVVAAAHPSDGTLPAGQIYHAAGPSADGWTVFAVHDSKSSWESFRDSVLVPRMQEGIEGGFTGPPEEIEFEIVVEIDA
jgi:hypothetical protein